MEVFTDKKPTMDVRIILQVSVKLSQWSIMSQLSILIGLFIEITVGVYWMYDLAEAEAT